MSTDSEFIPAFSREEVEGFTPAFPADADYFREETTVISGRTHFNAGDTETLGRGDGYPEGSLEFVLALSVDEGATRVTRLFKDAFGAEPAGVYRAPGRVNVIGEHTDYNGGLALPLALPHATYVAVSPRQDRRLRLVSSSIEGIIELELRELHESLADGTPDDGSRKFAGPGAYVGGTVLGLEDVLHRTGELPGFDVAVESCVPLGSGLSSSAALECSVAVAVDDLMGLDLAATVAGRHTLLEAGRLAENHYVGAPTGGLDQAAALLCREGGVILLDCRTFEAEPLPFDLSASGLALLVINTRATHDLADGQYGKRRVDCEVAAAALGVEYLGDLVPAGAGVRDIERSLAMLRDRLGSGEEADRVLRRSRHVLTEIVRTREFAAILQAGFDPEALGVLMNASHDSLRDDYQVTCPELDVAVDVARANGAYGARMTGGGFGGCAIALASADQVSALAVAITAAYAEHGWRAPEFLQALPSAPAEKCLFNESGK